MDGTVDTSSVTATVPYDDPRAAIRWLTEVLGFTAAAVFENPEGMPVFAELAWRTGFVFVSARAPVDNPWGKIGPASIALAAENAEAVDRLYDRALAVGAEIVRPVHDARTPLFPEGSHQFDLRDPEGNLWTVGTYLPRRRQ